jgi:hypothetical protein
MNNLIYQSQWFPIIAIVLVIWIFVSAETIILYVHGQDTELDTSQFSKNVQIARENNVLRLWSDRDL